MAGAGDLPRRRTRFGLLRRRRRPPSMTVMEHLRELRSRLVISLAAFAVVSAVTFMVFEPITNWLLKPLCSLPPERLGPQGCRLVATSAFEPFLVRLKVTALSAIVLAAPIWLYQLWAFIVPALTPKEKRYALPFVASSLLLFAAGGTFAYLGMPRGLNFLLGLGGGNLVPFLRAEEYLNFVGLMLLAFGAAFELPLLLFFLGLVGVVQVDQLRRFRRGALVTIALIAALVTPSQDPYTMVLMMVPLYGGYELCIVGLKVVARRRNRA